MPRVFVGVFAMFFGLIAADAFAGRIFGDIKVDGKPVSAGVLVTIAAVAPSADARTDSTVTDQYGSYKLNLKENGKCLLTVVHAGQTATLAVFSYEAPTRYDLALESKDGKLVLKRK